jgi:hypothetical protein
MPEWVVGRIKEGERVARILDMGGDVAEFFKEERELAGGVLENQNSCSRLSEVNEL